MLDTLVQVIEACCARHQRKADASNTAVCTLACWNIQGQRLSRAHFGSKVGVSARRWEKFSPS